MREYLVTLLLAAALCYVVTPFVRTWAIKFGAVAQIRTRDIHTTPTPRWGGLAMWISMALTFAMVNHLSLVGKSFGRESLGIFLAATLLVLIGLVDDRFELDALTCKPARLSCRGQESDAQDAERLGGFSRCCYNQRAKASAGINHRGEARKAGGAAFLCPTYRHRAGECRPEYRRGIRSLARRGCEGGS